MWATLIPAAANVAGAALKSGATPARSDAVGGYQVAPLGNSHWTVNIAGDGLGVATPWGAMSLIGLGVGLFLVSRWAAKKS